MQLNKWHDEINRFRAFKTTFILEGNVHDNHAILQKKMENSIGIFNL